MSNPLLRIVKLEIECIEFLKSLTDIPEITIGLVTMNEERTIGEAVRVALSELDSENGELIIVAGGTDKTVQIVKDMIAGRSNACLVEDVSPRGKPSALNRLITLARGNIIVLSDGDVIIRKGSISLLRQAFEDSKVACAGGRVVGKPGEYNQIQKVCDLMAQMIHLSRQRRYQSTGSIELASGYLLAVRKGFVQSIPEDTNSDDGFISLSVRSKGMRISYVENAVVAIGFPRTMADFLRQKTRTRYGHLQLRAHFPSTRGRSAGMEVGEFNAVRRARREIGYGLQISLLTVLLTSLTWISAYARFHFPWAFRKKVWQPVSSTK